MAPPKATSSKKRKTKETTSGSSIYNEYKFLSSFNKNLFFGWVSIRQIILEVGFQLGRDEHREIQIEFNRRGWGALCNLVKKVVTSIVREFYANAVPQPGQAYDFLSYVRGKTIDYSSTNLNKVLGVRATNSTRSYEERMKQLDPGFEEILNEKCVLNVQWIRDVDGRPNQLRRRDLCPQARGWLEFVRRSLIPTSNTYEVTIERDVLIYSIMKSENVNMGELIASNIHKILRNPKDSTRLAFPSIIQRLCDDAGVEKEIDELMLETDKPITVKKMEKVVAANPLQRAREHRTHA